MASRRNTRSVRASIRQLQICRQCQPKRRNVRVARASRRTFPEIFDRQKAVFVDGSLARLHVWPCQKQPCTKMAVRYFGKTTSGLNGSPAGRGEARKPARLKALSTNRSGPVPSPRTRDMISDRFWGVKMSIGPRYFNSSWGRPSAPVDSGGGADPPRAALKCACATHSRDP